MQPFLSMVGSILRTIFTVFTQTLTTDQASWEGYTARNITSAVTTARGTQVRVTFEAPAAASTKADRASIGVHNGTASQTTATPVELLFSGVSGFTITTGGTLVSDWATMVVPEGSKLVVIIDVAAAPASSFRYLGVADGHYNKVGASYNEANPSGMTGPQATSLGFNKIEVK